MVGGIIIGNVVGRVCCCVWPRVSGWCQHSSVYVCVSQAVQPAPAPASTADTVSTVSSVSTQCSCCQVRLQTQSSLNPIYRGAWDCVNQTVRKEGVLALYKGKILSLFMVQSLALALHYRGFARVHISISFVLTKLDRFLFLQHNKLFIFKQTHQVRCFLLDVE